MSIRNWKEGLQNTWYPCLATCKYDGEYLSIRNGIGTNNYGRQRAFSWFNLLPKNITFEAELIYSEGKLNENYLLNRKENKTNEMVLAIRVFDYKPSANSYAYRFENLKRILPKNRHIHLPIYRYCHFRTDLQTFYLEMVAQGYEGLVSVYCDVWTKIKTEPTVDLVVLGYGKVKEHAVLGYYPDKRVCTASLIGKGLSATLQGVKKIGVDHYDYLIEPRVVVEVKYQSKINGSLRCPRIVRLRNDKKPEECVK